MRKTQNIKAFTLIELSIVLVIIALLVGGVLAGQDVLTATKRNSIVTEVNTFRSAIANFRAKYFNNLPGDFEEAEKYWTSSVATDGDGDGRVDKPIDEPGESLLVWQHLSLAEMLSGNFTGAMDSSDLMVTGENVAGSDFSKALGYNLLYFNSALGTPDSSHSALNSNTIILGDCSTQVADTFENCAGGFIKPSDAESLDKKMDDGVAYSGKVLGQNDITESNGCSFDIDEAGADYELDSPSTNCFMIFNYKEFN